MFILETTPSFVWILISIIAAFLILAIVLSGILAHRLDNNIGNRTKNNVSMTLCFVVIAVNVVGLGFTFNQIGSIPETYNNPHSVNEEQRSDLKLSTSEVEKTIAEALKIDKAEVEATNEVGRKAQRGDMVDFVAVEEGKLIDGKFYFTEDSLEILVSGETDIVEHVSISTNE